MILPMIQFAFHPIKSKELKGSFEKFEMPKFNWHSWFDNSFQEGTNNYVENNFGFRNDFVRLHNQLDFSLFNIPHVKDVIIGKDFYLFEEGYIKEYCGTNYESLDTLSKYTLERYSRIKYLQDTLQKLGKQLVVVIAPGKPFYFPDKIPNHYLKEKKSETQYKEILNCCHNLNINHIDFNNWFINRKNTIDFPLYSKLGVHWTDYGASLSFDSLCCYFEKVNHKNFRNYYVTYCDTTTTFRKTDGDAFESLNTIWKLKCEKLKYLHYEKKEPDTAWKPQVLTVADSYYWTMLATDLPNKCFANGSEFWYYYNENWRLNNYVISNNPIVKQNLKEQIQHFDFVVLLCGGTNYQSIGMDFVFDLSNEMGFKK
jgi:hypothetical protein